MYLNALLIIAILGLAWHALIFLLTNSGYIKNYPQLFNKGLPLYYLISPCFYLYVRGSLNPYYAKFRKIDLLHLIIVIPGIVSIIPYNILDYNMQKEVVSKIAEDVRYGFSDAQYIVSPWHWFIFPISALVYNFLQFMLAKKASKLGVNTKTINWVYFFSGICFIIFTGMLVINISILKNLNNAWFILHQSTLILVLCSCLFILSLSFFVNPELIFGFSRNVNTEQKDLATQLEVDEKVSTEKLKPKVVDDKLIKQVELFIIEKEIFKQSGLTLSELASLLNVPSHKLSDLFNNHYKLNFNTYINNLRIDYVKKRLDNGDGKQFKLEAIALDAGFTSRNTFYVAFKKATGITPSAYLNELKRI